MNPYTSCIISY